MKSSHLTFSKFGLGSWVFGGSWQFGWGNQTDSDSVSTIQFALEQGIQWIDSAPIYGHGQSENIIYQATKHSTKPIFLASKCGLHQNSKNQIYRDLSPEMIQKEITHTLKRLRRDHLDLYQIHWPLSNDENCKAWEKLQKLKEQKIIHYAGVCNFNIEQLEHISQISPPDTLQNSFSLIHPEGLQYEIKYCQENHIQFIAYSPLANGLLTQKATQTWFQQLSKDDFRKNHAKDFKEPQWSQHRQLIHYLSPWLKKYQCQIQHLALAWILHHPQINSILLGARTPTQLEDNLIAQKIHFSPNDFQEINHLIQEQTKTMKII